MTRVRFSLCIAVIALGCTAAAAAVPLEPAPGMMTVHEVIDGRTVCRIATPDEDRVFGGAEVPMHIVYPEPGQVRLMSGLQITLMGTDQLEANPAAKAAFIRAAQKWEAKVAIP